ncbi:MAG: DUF1415 domain-containing protein [Burkholderiales bacterium]|nr:DUF1415 domain-containing protein [Burkholderiales bacterium]MDP2396877.1 DUF1415 domain-containing protein [Burkholderiales bacterium]
MRPSDEDVIAATQDWLVKAVIGLNLCPFARAVYAGGRIRYAVSRATMPEALLETLAEELQRLATADEAETETTLLIHPEVLGDFFDYNDFLEIADELVAELGYEGVLQVASFHPQYQFAETEADDIGNFTNRSPYPTLHLLRESSVERAVAAHPDTDRIYRDNIETLRRLGHEGWGRLDIGRPAPKK